MKKIIKQARREEAEYICDLTGKPAVGKLLMVFDWTSRHDFKVLEVDLADEAAEEILKFLQSKNAQIQTKDQGLAVRHCPLCGRG
jgi:hypothetical protein